jgi:hypothetical protein
MSILDEHNKGLPYGSIPYTEILSKLEETDMNMSSDDMLHRYNEYMRDEITDWSLEKPYLESDTARRNPAISKTILNVHHNGTRGELDYPQHPELFFGFMDPDNRGIDNNPRMEEYNKQIKTRMPNLVTRMGNNSTDTDTQSPWTNQSLSQCRRDLQTSLAYNTKIFTTERDGRLFNRNTIAVNADPRLLHGDPLPSTAENERIVNTSSVNQRVSTINKIKQEGELSNSFYNKEYANNTPKIPNHNNSRNDHEIKETYENTAPQQYALRLKNLAMNEQDQNHHISYNNSQRSQNPHPIHININNTRYDTEYNEHSQNPIHKSNLTQNITNSTYMDNDVQLPNSLTNKQNKTDHYKKSNAMDYITVDVYNPTIQDVQRVYGKNKIQNTISDNTLTVIEVPDYKFNENVLGVHFTLLKNIQRSDHTIPNTYQIESVNITNPYRFNDNILMMLHTTVTGITDKTSENSLKSVGNPMQEHKIKNIRFDNSWNISNENVSSKSQKQVRTSGTDDQSVYNIKNSNDFESINGGNVLGNKCIRGDYMENDNSTVDDKLNIV